jgi:hypothetical protein
MLIIMPIYFEGELLGWASNLGAEDHDLDACTA